tara:strand:+ start:134 stop:562 length:429 start_codon:yes stop_codon:yes gene_type:complete
MISKFSIFYFLILFIIIGCTEKISYTGIIFDEKKSNYQELINKEEIIINLGKPSFVDPIEKKYLYYSEKIKTKNYFNTKIDQRILLVFKFNETGNVISFEKFNLENENDLKIVKKTTSHELVKQGFIEKIFGGVGAGAPTTP